MGMQQKLDKAYQEGLKEGQKQSTAQAFIQGQLRGSSDTWDLVEEMFLEIKGIGPKTQAKIIRMIQQHVRKEG